MNSLFKTTGVIALPYNSQVKIISTQFGSTSIYIMRRVSKSLDCKAVGLMFKNSNRCLSLQGERRRKHRYPMQGVFPLFTLAPVPCCKCYNSILSHGKNTAVRQSYNTLFFLYNTSFNGKQRQTRRRPEVRLTFFLISCIGCATYRKAGR